MPLETLPAWPGLLPLIFNLDRQPATPAEARRVVAQKNAEAAQRIAQRERDHENFLRHELPELKRKAAAGVAERRSPADLSPSAIYARRRGEARG